MTAQARYGVLETKLMPPRLRPPLIERRRLVDPLLSPTDEPVVAVVAPAGYGKSTLLAQWRQVDPRPFAWYSADRHDDDPVSLVYGIAAAIDRVRPLSARTLAAIDASRPSVWSSAVPGLAAAVAKLPPSVLVIDDVQAISNAESIEVVMTIGGHVGGGSRLALAGRALDGLPLGRLAAARGLDLIGRDNLAFEATESAELMAQTDPGEATPAEEASRLHERMEGWPAGIYLGSMARRHRSTGARTSSPPSTDSGLLLDIYVRDEILQPLPDDEADFLIRSSVLERLSGALCDAALETTGSGPRLDAIERRNLFLIPLGDRRVWFRYHHLFADLLRAELERREPDAAPAILARAAAWYERDGQLETALDQAIAAGDEARALRLMRIVAQPTANAGRMATVRRWFSWLDRLDSAEPDALLAVIAAFVFGFDGDAPRAERWMDRAVALEATADKRAAGLISFGRVFFCRVSPEAMTRSAGEAEAAIIVDDPWRVAVVASAALAAYLVADTDLATIKAAEAVVAWERGSPAHIAAIVAILIGAWIALDLHDWAGAEGGLRRARVIVRDHGLTDHAVGAAVEALAARIAIHHGATLPARTSLTHAQRLRPLLSRAVPWLTVRVLLDLAHVMAALGDTGGARTLVVEARDVIRARPNLGVLVGQAEAMQGRLSAALEVLRGSTTLTMAELRLLPYLRTHLTFREIGERLFVSANTVKTQAISIYRKLDATTRSEAVQRAVAAGLLDAAVPGVGTGELPA